MDDASNKAITIAVGVLITIIVTSGVLFSVGQMQRIYSQVYETDVSIQNRFDEFDTYKEGTSTKEGYTFSGNVKTGIEIVNALNRYMNDTIVLFRYKNLDYTTPEAKEKLISNINESTLYVTSVEEKSGFTTIMVAEYKK
ncbi:MAG: hypothetical protein PHP54_03450 [Clostridia bacterium]|nr:hypothetical protein [Clostridia bacterium]